MAFSVNYLHYIGMKPSCYFSGHNVNLLMSLCCIILIAPPCPFHISHPCNEVFLLFVIKNIFRCTFVSNEVHFCVLL